MTVHALVGKVVEVKDPISVWYGQVGLVTHVDEVSGNATVNFQDGISGVLIEHVVRAEWCMPTDDLTDCC